MIWFCLCYSLLYSNGNLIYWIRLMGWKNNLLNIVLPQFTFEKSLLKQQSQSLDLLGELKTKPSPRTNRQILESSSDNWSSSGGRKIIDNYILINSNFLPVVTHIMMHLDFLIVRKFLNRNIQSLCTFLIASLYIIWAYAWCWVHILQRFLSVT